MRAIATGGSDRPSATTAGRSNGWVVLDRRVWSWIRSRRALGPIAAGLLTLAISGGALASDAAVTVTNGTTILAPPAVELVGATGSRGTSDAATLSWWTNDEAMAITVVASDLICVDPACGAPEAPDTIASSALSLVTASGAAGSLDQDRAIVILADVPSEEPSSTARSISVAIPGVRPGRYAGVLGFAVVDPAGLVPSSGAHVRGWAVRVYGGPDGASAVTSPMVVTVR